MNTNKQIANIGDGLFKSTITIEKTYACRDCASIDADKIILYASQGIGE